MTGSVLGKDSVRFSGEMYTSPCDYQCDMKLSLMVRWAHVVYLVVDIPGSAGGRSTYFKGSSAVFCYIVSVVRMIH